MICAKTLVPGLLAVVLVAVPAGADDPPKKLTPEEREELYEKWDKLDDAGRAAYEAGKYPDAEKAWEASLELARRLYPKSEFPNGHGNLAHNMNDLAFLYHDQGKLADAEPLFRDALEMRKRLFKGDHPDVATSLSNLAYLYLARGKLADAEPLYTDALAMRRRLFKGDHPAVATSLSNLAGLYDAQGNLADAESHAREALAMSRRLTVAFARQKAEGEALTLAESLPLYRDSFLSVALRGASDPATVYPEAWASKGNVPRVYERRQLRSRAAATNPEAAKLLADLTDARRRRAELLLAPATQDPGTRKRRADELTELDTRVVALDAAIRPLLPAVARIEKLDAATPADLRKALPADAAFVDYLRYTFFEYDPKKPGQEGQKRTERYLAFVVTRNTIAWVDLDTAAKIEAAVGQWREAITTPPHAVPADIPAKVRELVWEPVRKHIPAGTTVVYVSPDAALTRVPWAALPGDKAGTILLEDFAVAAVPHATFLLDMLWPADRRDDPPTGLLAVGGVAFGGEPVRPGLWGALASASRTRGDLPVDPKKGLHWPDLPGARTEAEQVARRASDRKLATELLAGSDASTDAVLAALPRVKYAHIATHGFFADAQFRSVLQVDPKDYEKSWRGERIGRAANNPMVMSGLVFAGANLPRTPGRGIVTGDALIDRDLSGLELAVLSACETGLGDVAGGEGVYGLQRAFHIAGTRNVVASLWKVPDAATAALMGEFYKAVWDDNLPPVLALRKAQLAVYRADPKQFAEMARRGPGLGDQNLDTTARVIGKTPVNPGGKNPPVVWAACSLSGPGR